MTVNISIAMSIRTIPFYPFSTAVTTVARVMYRMVYVQIGIFARFKVMLLLPRLEQRSGDRWENVTIPVSRKTPEIGFVREHDRAHLKVSILA